MNAQRPRRYLLVTSLGALGIVYGDIGTSPLYAFRETFVATGQPAVTKETVLGILSLMCWSLIFVVTIKYLIFVMRADNHGEGGILALTALIRPEGRLRPTVRRGGLILIGLFGTALLYGDGIITPAISVLSAVEGIEVAVPGTESLILPLAVVILVALFSVQRRGTAAVGAVFGPVMTVWFVVLGLLGLHQILNEPSVLAALSPLKAIGFAVEEPRLSFFALGAVFLVVTGSEALYADMGHFGKRPIRLAWFTLVLPALLLNYFGQGALLLNQPDAVDSPFYRMAPSWAAIPLVVLATMATVIASQALITGAYSLTMQAVQLGYLPRVRIDHTSPREIGQVYVPVVNYGLMVACVALVLTFQSSTSLAAAYGVAVTTTMLITTALLHVVMRERWNWSATRAGIITTVFVLVDVAFFSANIIKVPAGGWFPLVVGAIIFTVMTTWKRGRVLMTVGMRRGELPIERFIGSIVAHPQQRVSGTAVYLFPDPGATPPALLTNLRHNEVLHETVVLVSVLITDRPHVPRAKRVTVHDLGAGFRQVTLRFGFMDQPDVPAALANIVHGDLGFDPSDAAYFLGKETILATKRHGMAEWRDRLFSLLHRNAANAAQYYALPADSTVEIGRRVEI